jgi:hypothetical protein
MKTTRKNSTARNTKLKDEKQEDKITAKNNCTSKNTELNGEKQYDKPQDGITCTNKASVEIHLCIYKHAKIA